jgi:recombinational DNA repair protein RecT
MEREELIIKITELEKITRVSERSRDSSKGRNNEHEINIKLMAEIKVLNQKLHKYEQVIADLENQLGEQHHKEEELNRKIDGLLHSRRNTSPERGDLALKVIQLEQELNQARLMTNRDTSRT